MQGKSSRTKSSKVGDAHPDGVRVPTAQFLAKRMEDARRNQQPLLDELRAVGLDVPRVSQLRPPLPPRAVEVLLEWLGRPEDDTGTQEEIVRALAYRGSPSVVRERLINVFRGPLPAGAPAEFRWVVGEALRLLGPGDRGPEFVELAGDHGWGSSRERLVAALGSIRSDDADAVILDSLEERNDVGLLQAALEATRKRRLEAARAPVTQLTRHSDGEIRAWARQTLSVLQRVHRG